MDDLESQNKSFVVYSYEDIFSLFLKSNVLAAHYFVGERKSPVREPHRQRLVFFRDDWYLV